MRSIILISIVAVSLFRVSALATIINIPDDYPTIQQGIDASTDGDTVLVQPGTYVENINFNGHTIVLGSLFLTTGDTVYISQTIVDGNHDDTAITIEDINLGTASLIGLTIMRGSGIDGGAIHCQNSSLSIAYCRLFDNSGYAKGGGICIINSTVSIEGCKVLWNCVYPARYGYESIGGGIYCGNSEVLIAHNIIENNIAVSTPMMHQSGEGGGIYCKDSSLVTIVGNSINNNWAGNRGVGVYCSDSDILISGNVISGNYSYFGDWGGGVISTGCNTVIINNAIMANEVLGSGGGVRSSDNGRIVNNVIRENLPDQIAGSGVSASYCNIQGGWEGEGNIDTDPLFRDPENGDFHLMSIACGDPYDSPCIDAGDPAIIDSLLDCSWGLGQLRSDMGAYGGGDSATVVIDDLIDKLPSRFALFQNYPNPFNASTVIRYMLPEPSQVTIEIYNILGRRVETLVDERQQVAGYHQVVWNARDLSSGIYLYRIQAGHYLQTNKMILLR
jgi:hypothetical protein